MKKMTSSNKVIAGMVALVAALFVSVLMTSESFRRKVDATMYEIYTMFDEADAETAKTQSAWDRLRGKKTRGDVQTLADKRSPDNIQAAKEVARTFVSQRSKSGRFPIYDEVGGKLLELSLMRQHDEVGQEADILVSCFDFRDDAGRVVDVDVLVAFDGDEAVATQARLHSIDGESRLPQP